jgi:hypothetical protein
MFTTDNLGWITKSGGDRGRGAKNLPENLRRGRRSNVAPLEKCGGTPHLRGASDVRNDGNFGLKRESPWFRFCSYHSVCATPSGLPGW